MSKCSQAVPASPPERRRRWLARLTLLMASFVFTLAMLEGGVRLTVPPLPSRDTGIVPHPLWHHWHRPNYSFTYHVTAEGYAKEIRFNEHGMRDTRAVPLVKQPGIFRIAVLGDSFVEALQVDEQDGICKRLEAVMSSSAPCEVLNFGCSGFSSSLELVLLREWVLRFEPDFVVCLHHFSDLTEDWRFRRSAMLDGNRVLAVPATGTGMSRRLRGVLELSQAYRIGSAALDRAVRHRAPSPDASLKDSFDAIARQPYTDDDREAWCYSLSHVAEMARLCETQGVPLLVAIIPIGTQVEPVDAAFAKQVGYRYLAEGKLLEHTGYQEIVASTLNRPGQPCLDLLDAFRQASPGGKQLLYLPRDQHWTAVGHDLAARTIASRLRAQLPHR